MLNVCIVKNLTFYQELVKNGLSVAFVLNGLMNSMLVLKIQLLSFIISVIRFNYFI